ncbi:MAG: hypothetical protein P0Y64_01890 [Candidatus Sphingomonas colombiensis]|nr:hypothetical protein [Sphingomonas sp.]WEK43607.1 MAG: hypothetical protein P0Y64_01890 [Sphingomonas sp.]
MAAVVAGLIAIAPLTFAPLTLPFTALLVVLAAVMFLVTLFDGATRQAVDAFNQRSKGRWRNMSWHERFFSRSYGDLRLLIINRLIALEMLAFIFTGIRGRQFALIAFIGFALSTLMLMLMMKHQPDILRRNGN